jgi:hypothetical protein
MQTQVNCLKSQHEAHLSEYVTLSFECQMTKFCLGVTDHQNKYGVKLLSRLAKRLGLLFGFSFSREEAYIVLLMGIGNQHRINPILL